MAAESWIRHILFVCPNGEINADWYQGVAETNPNLRLGKLEIGLTGGRTGVYCNEGASLSDNEQKVADMIVASLRLQKCKERSG